MNKKITVTALYEHAKATMPAEHIDHHASDLYLKKTPASTKLIEIYEHKQIVTTFKDNIDNVTWYDIPFAYHLGEN